jgi:alpha-mannosidase
MCQAHLDPVWMWTWDEGMREAISTFHTAAVLLEDFPEFVFNHNESLLYEWVEEYDPPLFERIKQLVQAGRWNICGGWYLQPDCNLPGGETLARVILEGRRYFDEKFGVRPPVAYNFDTFGHPNGLPQLMRQSGFALYVHCRPTASQMDLPAPLYRWRGADGSEILALRPDAGWYCTPGVGIAQTQARQGIEIARKTGQDVLVPWGLGDHGGGPTRRDLEAFRELFAEFEDSDIEIRHSTPEAFLNRMQPYTEELPVVEGELQRTLTGCYTSVAPIKREMRASEAMLASAERWAAIDWWRTGATYPAEDLRAAWKRMLLNTFHDTLCGSLLEDAVPGVMEMFGYTRHIARRITLKGQHAMLPNVTPQPNTIPVYVLNPHGAAMKSAVGLNFLSDYFPPAERKTFALYDDTGAQIAHQEIGGSTVLQQGTWQPFVGFVADVPPLAARRYEVRFEGTPALSAGLLDASEDLAGITVETETWVARFNRDTAALASLVHKATGHEALQGPVRLFANHDVAHAWGGENRPTYNEPFAPFAALSPEEVGDFAGVEGETGPALRIIAQGPVSVTVEGLVGWQHSRASIRVTLYADLPQIDFDVRLYMQARRKMIKLQMPFDLPGTRAICEVPYGSAERAADATEWPYSRWLRLESPALTVGVANNGQNGFDVSDAGVLNLSLSRGATHCSWEGDPGGPAIDTGKPYTYMDQGQIDTRFRLIADGSAAALTAALIPAALELNQPLERFYTFYPPTLPATAQPVPFLAVEPATVAIGALKKAETEEALIVRLAESTGQHVTARVSLDGGPVQEIAFGPHEIKNFKIARHNGDVQWQPCNLIEE